jgi:site-specific DNA recombinase
MTKRRATRATEPAVTRGQPAANDRGTLTAEPATAVGRSIGLNARRLLHEDAVHGHAGVMVRVAIYIRASADEEHQPFSLEAQEHKLGSYITSQDNWKLVKIYRERASGATTDREELQKALTGARAHRFDVLLVYRVDRLARSIRGLAHILDELDKVGVVFRSATEPFDTATAAGRMMVQMLGVFAEFERATIIDRVINGMERKAARGGWTAGQRPFGYNIDRGTGYLVVNEDEAPLVPVIFDLYAHKRLGVKSVAKWLNGRGHRTKFGKPWSGESLLGVLRSRVYLGEVYFRGQWHKAPHPPLIDPALFEEVQVLLTARGEDHAKRAGNASDYELAGLMVCARCGKRYVGTAAHGRSRRYRYYTCFTRNRYNSDACNAERIPADQVEEAILQALLDTYSSHDLIDRAIAAYAAASDDRRDQHQAELATVESQLAAKEAAIERYLRSFEAGAMPEHVCGPRVQELANQVAELRDRRAELHGLLHNSAVRRGPQDDQLAAIRDTIYDIITHGTPQTRKALLQALVYEIKVAGRHHIQPYFRVPTTNNVSADPLTCEDAVRETTILVGDTGIEPVTSSV